MRTCLLPSLTVMMLTGCASHAVRPPTPAADIRAEDLEVEPTPPNVRYYGLIFGSQSVPKIARYCHTWATVVMVTDVPGDPPRIVDDTISWMPATFEVKIWNFRVEPGVNLDLHATVREVKSHGERIALWGPYEMRPGLYHKFILQKQFMESGQVGYQAADNIGEAARRGNGCDCIHAITDLDSQLGRQAYPDRRYGYAASKNIVQKVAERGGINTSQTHDWLIDALGLTDCVQQRPFQCGRSLLRCCPPRNWQGAHRNDDNSSPLMGEGRVGVAPGSDLPIRRDSR